MIIKDKCCVIIVAGGKGKRMSASTVKQFLSLNNKPILAHTIDKFERNEKIHEIIIVIGKEEKKYCENNIIKKYNYKKIKAVIEGGKERQDSVYNGLKKVSKDISIVLVHDAVRPFIEEKDIVTVINTTVEKNACALGVPCKDTIKVVSKNNEVEKSLDRSKLWCMQTPQGFKYDIVIKAYKNAEQKNLVGTDDATLVEIIGEKVYIVEGNYNNIKITTPEDLEYAKFLIK